MNSKLVKNASLSVLNGTMSSTFIDLFRRPNIRQMKKLIQKYNKRQSILNEDMFGPLDNDSVLIVVQVHTRINYLRHLIVSLAQARDISRSLVIFSHDYYDEEINDLIQSIDFCKVMQVSQHITNVIKLLIVNFRFFIRTQYKRIRVSFLEMNKAIVPGTSNVISKPFIVNIKLTNINFDH